MADEKAWDAGGMRPSLKAFGLLFCSGHSVRVNVVAPVWERTRSFLMARPRLFCLRHSLPLSALFMSLDDLNSLARKSDDSGPMNTTIEVCLIGLVAYFEAFLQT